MKQDSSQERFSEFSVVLCSKGDVIATAGSTQTGQLLRFKALEPLIQFLMDQTKEELQLQRGDIR